MKLSRKSFISFLSSVVALVACSTAMASDTTTGNASYEGDLLGDGFFDEVTLTDGADWFVLNLITGQPISLTISQGDVGDLLLNASIFDGIAADGETVGDAGLTELFFSPLTNVNTGSLTSITGGFTPSITGQYTLIVTTWTGQNGTYDIDYSGFTSVPEPTTFTLCAVLGLVAVARRRQRRRR